MYRSSYTLPARAPAAVMKPIYQYAVSVQELDKRTCDWCGAETVRGTTVRGKSSWFDVERDDRGGYLNHWATCPERAKRKASIS
jgi:hypothetical protein